MKRVPEADYPSIKVYDECARTALEQSLDEAKDKLRDVLASESDHYRACSAGVRFWQFGHRRLAILAYRRSIELHPTWDAYLNLATCYDDLEEVESARDSIRRFYLLVPSPDQLIAAEKLLARNGKGHLVRNNGSGFPTASVIAIFEEAERQGWLAGRELRLVPDLMENCDHASEYFCKLLTTTFSPSPTETLVCEACRILFGKAVEWVMLWGISPGSEISINIDASNLLGEVEYEVRGHRRRLVTESMKVGQSLFEIHHGIVMDRLSREGAVDLKPEIRDTLLWVPRLGISYALHMGYNEPR